MDAWRRQMTPLQAAADVRRQLARAARPLGAFDPSRYFRAEDRIVFRGVPTPVVRSLARAFDVRYGMTWGVRGAVSFADTLVSSPCLEDKAVGILLLARHHREFIPDMLRVFRGWLAGGRSRNWATTDAICGYLIGPLLLAYPRLVPAVAGWASDRNLWVRRASAVGLIKPVNRGADVRIAYRVALELRRDEHDLIHKAAGWLLREAGKVDPVRLARFLATHGRRLPRTTVRYAIERFTPAERLRLLRVTSATRRSPRRQ